MVPENHDDYGLRFGAIMVMDAGDCCGAGAGAGAGDGDGDGDEFLMSFQALHATAKQ